VIVFFVLVLGGLFSVICRVVSIGASQWVRMSLTFLPMFICAGLLLAAGFVLVRVYVDEMKGREISFFKTIKGTRSLFLGIPHLTLPLIFTYLILWMALGVFYLLKEIPQIGPFMSSVLSFGPFLLVLGSLLLGLSSLLLLFFMTPVASMRSEIRPQVVKEVFKDFMSSPFMSFTLIIVALLPTFLVVGLLSLAAVVTQIFYIESGSILAVAMKWLFVMIPFCALLAPSVVFFFNFSVESFNLLRKSAQTV